MDKPSNQNEADWYCKISGEELGPLTNDDLYVCVRDGAISADTLIKMGSDGEWVKADTVENLLMSSHQESTSTASAASEALSGLDAKRVAVVEGKSSDNSLKRNRSQQNTGFNFSGLFAIPALVIEYLAEKFSFLGYLLRLWIIIPVLLIALGVLVNILFITPWYYQKNAFDQYQTIWTELKQLRSEKASDEKWKAFYTTSSVKLNKTIASLKKTANAKNQEHLFLLRAGRDNLSKMLNDARFEIPASEKKFKEQMESIEMIRQYSGQKSNKFQVSPLMLLFIITDVVIVIWVLFVLFRRRSY